MTIYTILSRANAHTRASAHPPLLTVLWFFRDLRVTAHHANFCIVNLKVGPLSPHSSDALWTSRHQVRTHLSVAWLNCSIPPLQHEIHTLQATTECCRNLATRLLVAPLCSTIRPSPLSGWPRRSTDEPMMQVDSAPLLPTSHPGWAFAEG